MAAGEIKHSPIVRAITEAEAGTTGEIRVHLSRHWIEPNTLKRARRLFARFGMQRTEHRNGILLYVNLRRKRLAVVGDVAIDACVGEAFWKKLISDLERDLRATHFENAISNTVRKIGEELARHFPAGAEGHTNNELPNLVTED